jgi:hypothetical protein
MNINVLVWGYYFNPFAVAPLLVAVMSIICGYFVFALDRRNEFYQAFFIGTRQTKQLALIHFVNTIARVKNTNITVDTVIM